MSCSPEARGRRIVLATEIVVIVIGSLPPLRGHAWGPCRADDPRGCADAFFPGDRPWLWGPVDRIRQPARIFVSLWPTPHHSGPRRAERARTLAPSHGLCRDIKSRARDWAGRPVSPCPRRYGNAGTPRLRLMRFRATYSRQREAQGLTQVAETHRADSEGHRWAAAGGVRGTNSREQVPSGLTGSCSTRIRSTRVRPARRPTRRMAGCAPVLRPPRACGLSRVLCVLCR